MSNLATRMRPLVAAGLATIALLGLSVQGLAAETAAAAVSEGPTVSVVSATNGEVAEQIVVTGSLVPREEVLVTPEIEGLGVAEVLVDEGDHVTKGEVLARLNRDTLDVQIVQFAAQLAQADASTAQAEAQVAQAKANRLMASRAFDRTTDRLIHEIEHTGSKIRDEANRISEHMRCTDQLEQLHVQLPLVMLR